MSATTSDTSKKIVRALPYVAVGIAVCASLCWFYKQYGCSRTETETVEKETLIQPTDLNASADKPESLPNLTRNEVLQLIDEVIQTQSILGRLMKETVNKMLNDELVGVKAIYQYIYEHRPVDPIAARNISMSDFDKIMEKYTDDAEINDRIVMILNGPTQLNHEQDQEDASRLTADDIASINSAMLNKMQEAVREIKLLEKVLTVDGNSPVQYSPRVANLTAQAIIGAFVKKEMKISAEAVEMGMMMNQMALSSNLEFLNAHEKIQSLLDTLGEDDIN